MLSRMSFAINLAKRIDSENRQSSQERASWRRRLPRPHAKMCQLPPLLNHGRRATMLKPREGSAEQMERSRIDVETERWKHWRRRGMPARSGKGRGCAEFIVPLCAIPWCRPETGRTEACPTIEESWIAFLERISEDAVVASSRLCVKGMARLVTEMSGRSTMTFRNLGAVQRKFTIFGQCAPPATGKKQI